MNRIVLLTNPIAPEAMDALAAIATLVIAPDPSPDTLVDAARDADVIVVRAPLPDRLFDVASRLRGVVRHGAGLDMIPLEVASAHGVAVANVPAVNARSVAEFAVGQMIALSRHTTRMDRALRADSWSSARVLADSAVELSGKTVAIVGMGAVGQALVDICVAGFRMKVIGVRRANAASDERIEYRSLDDALVDADFVVLACPLSEATRGMIDARRLASMKSSAYLVNVARGAIVVESALIDAIEQGRIAGAALDVFEHQPLAATSRLRDFPQVILSPHVGGVSIESMQRMGVGAVAQVAQILDGVLPTHLVNPEAKDAITARWTQLDS